MNFRTTSIIIRREYLQRVKKKSFLLITFLVPVLFAALCILPSIIMMGAKEETKKIAVVDNSGIVLPFLTDNETSTFTDFTSMGTDKVKSSLSELGMDALLSISELIDSTKSLSAVTYSEKPLGMDMTDNIKSKINKAVEDYRIRSYEIENLEEIMESVHSNISLTSYTMDEKGKETLSESGVYMMVSMILGMIVYMFIALFCGMVMSGVIEEKSSRVVEVLVSSVKATELMFGKILGVALVALTQFFLWIILTLLLITGAALVIGKDKFASLAADPSMMDAVGGAGMSALPSEGTMIFSTLANMPWGQIIISFVIFFVFGYLLYASVFAAIGSAAENEADTQQLQIPVTVPLLLGFFIAIYAFKAPGSQLVFWGSMIPFTSPIVMLARIPFGVPVWQLLVSSLVLVATFAACAYLSAKIYKVGILMFGKKTTWKDLWKWLKQN